MGTSKQKGVNSGKRSRSQSRAKLKSAHVKLHAQLRKCND